jgi:tripartite-type tricarboxylate transporter receptor subunit TctC
MKLRRRTFLHMAAGAAVLPTLPRVASALDYPTRPVHLIAGFPPGGIVDATARLTGQWLSERLGQPFIVENRPGASSNIATEAVARAAPDGYTLLLVSANNALNATLDDKLSFDFIRDIAPVGSISRAPFVMEVGPSVPAKTVPEFIAYAKANPGKLRLATAGPGSGQHIYGELFKMMAGVALVTVHYAGAGTAFPDLMSGRVDVLFDPVASSIGHIRAGKLRPLGVTTATRTDVLPDVPPIGDFVPGYEATGWNGIGAPANTPPEIIAILNKQVNAALADPTFRARLVDSSVEPFANSPVEFGRFIVEYTERWAKVIRAANIKLD